MRTILLVEDDPLQALVRKSILEKRFPDVKRVADAAEALCLIEQRVFSENLGLVISGHHAHGLSGPAFVAELHSRLPEVPVLVLGSAAESARDYTSQGVRFLAKPVATEEIVAAAREMVLKDARPTA
ncbi:MAG TPA: response regulator [Terracidiphilus sp.]|nr:response regulator [Terracidiphilus sp.]